MEFNNATNLVFTDIQSEEYREYEFDSGRILKITAPLKLNVAPSGGHRLYDEAGVSHYIPKGWIALRWKARVGQPNFVK